MTEMYLAPIDGREADIFGSGINCISGRAVSSPAALTGVTAGGYEDRSFDQRHLLVVQDSQSYASLLQTAASLSASGLTWSASASMSFLRDQTGSETSISFVGLRVHRSQLRVADMSHATVAESVMPISMRSARSALPTNTARTTSRACSTAARSPVGSRS
jgi:hypothetical protein